MSRRVDQTTSSRGSAPVQMNTDVAAATDMAMPIKVTEQRKRAESLVTRMVLFNDGYERPIGVQKRHTSARGDALGWAIDLVYKSRMAFDKTDFNGMEKNSLGYAIEANYRVLSERMHAIKYEPRMNKNEFDSAFLRFRRDAIDAMINADVDSYHKALGGLYEYINSEVDAEISDVPIPDKDHAGVHVIGGSADTSPKTAQFAEMKRLFDKFEGDFNGTSERETERNRATVDTTPLREVDLTEGSLKPSGAASKIGHDAQSPQQDVRLYAESKEGCSSFKTDTVTESVQKNEDDGKGVSSLEIKKGKKEKISVIGGVARQFILPILRKTKRREDVNCGMSSGADRANNIEKSKGSSPANVEWLRSELCMPLVSGNAWLPVAHRSNKDVVKDVQEYAAIFKNELDRSDCNVALLANVNTLFTWAFDSLISNSKYIRYARAEHHGAIESLRSRQLFFDDIAAGKKKMSVADMRSISGVFDLYAAQVAKAAH